MDNRHAQEASVGTRSGFFGGRFRLAALVLLVCSLFAAGAYALSLQIRLGGKPVYGPVKFTLGSSVLLFASPKAGQQFALVVENGDLQSGRNRASSVRISLNGQVVLNRDILQSNSVIQAPVTLRRLNSLTVRVNGAPRSYINVSIRPATVNRPPVANAGSDRTIAVGSLVQLDGSASSDADSDGLSFDWVLTGRPAGSVAQLSNPKSVQPTFVADRRGNYSIRLIVNDGTENSPQDSVTISTARSAPVANAGPDQTARIGDPVILDGSASSDVDGDALSYAWSFVSKPTGSNASLLNASAVQPRFTIDRAGSYVVQLIVNDGASSSLADQVRIDTVNSRPVANAGPDQTAGVNDVVTLDGSASTDVDGDGLTYLWSLTSIPARSTATLSDPSAVRPTFKMDVAGTYVAQLIVNDGVADSAPDTASVSTRNSAPVANAGPDQGVAVGASVFLDGQASADVDGNPLTYRWSLLSKPTGSAAVLADSTTATPSFRADRRGNYSVQLIVNDGIIDSAPDEVMVSTGNARPLANAGADQTAEVGDTVTLDGSASSDADGDPLTFVWSLLARPNNSLAVLVGANGAKPQLAPDEPGDYVTQLIVSDGELDSAPDTAMVTVAVPSLNQAPDINSLPPTTATVGTLYSYDVQATDPDGDTLSYRLILAPVGMSINISTGLIQWGPLAAGNVPVSVEAKDPDGASDTQTWMISVAAAPVTVPNVVGQTRTEAEDEITDAGFTVGTVTQQNDATIPAGSVISQSPSAGTTVAPGTAVNLVVSLGPVGGGGGLPPDPGTIAPPNDPTETTLIGDSTAFLYTGANPIQTGVTPGIIEARRAAVIRGRVLDRSNQPLSNVTVTILDHPELGQTLSRADGMFDLAVNGGGGLTLDYRRTGYLPVQRQIDVPWQDYVAADDIVMIGLDPQVTTISLGVGQAMQIAQGSPVADSDGARRATILFPQGIQATMTMPNGSTVPLSTLNVRATEYTVGENGPEAMPAELPASSGYTYAIELSVDEAMAAGATRVTFSQPLPFYVENFLNFPVGGIVPVGWYDRTKSACPRVGCTNNTCTDPAWISSENGRIIAVLSIGGDGLALLDVDGSGNPATATALTTLGITNAERRELAKLYLPGKSLWRAPIPHFTPWDLNWSVSPPANAIAPPNARPKTPQSQNPPTSDSTRCPGCTIEAQSQALGEEVPIAGSPFSLHYRSDRVPGYLAARKIEIPVTQSIPGSLRKIDLAITVAGQVHRESIAPAANIKREFHWNGRDAYGRPYRGIAGAQIDVCYEYPALAVSPAEFGNAFSAFSEDGISIGGNRAASTISICKNWSVSLLGEAPGNNPLGGWTLGIHHAYDSIDGALHLGDGGRRDSAELGSAVIRTIAGNGQSGFNGDSVAATETSIGSPWTVSVGADGSVYVSSTSSNRIRRIDASGFVTTIAGNGSRGFSGDCGSAADARLNAPEGFALGPDGSIYIGDAGNSRIRKVSADGIITTVAGNGTRGFSGDGGAATNAQIGRPWGLGVGADGSLYIAEYDNHRIRRVGSDGVIATVVGNGSAGSSGDGGPAADARIDSPTGVVVGPDGSLFIAESRHRVRRVRPDGVITTVAGNGIAGFSGDGGAATSANLSSPDGLAVGPDGAIYIADAGTDRVRRVGPDGIITTVSGNGSFGFGGDGGPATDARHGFPNGPAIGPDGGLYIADFSTHRIRLVSPALPGFDVADRLVSSEDGSEIYRFSAAGRHLETVDTVSRSVIHRFGYDPAGLLTSVTDLDGDITRIERGGDGTPQAIVSPDGQRTVLAFNADGYLASVANPAGEATTIGYAAGGLMTAFTDPRGNVDRFEYDSLGRLTRNTNAIGGGFALARAETANGHANTLTSGEGRASVFGVDPLTTGDRRQTNTSPDGTVQQKLFKTNGEQTTTAADGTVTTVKEGPDPRFGMQSPVPTSSSVRTPAGLTLNLGTQRTAALANTADPSSLTSLTETATLNGRNYSSAFTAATRTYTGSTPVGRQSTTEVNDKNRPVRTETAGLNPATYAYDARGRLQTLTVGAGAEARSTAFTYHGSGPQQGYLASITDAENHTVNFAYDAAGRMTTQTLPDGRTIGFGYDAGGNLASLAPPGRPAHQFTYTGVDQTQSYVPPAVPGGGSTAYEYDLDKALTRLTRPDGIALNYAYDSAGRLGTLTTPEGAMTYSYAPTTGKLTGIAAPGGLNLAYSYDGALLTQTQLTGPVAGTVGYTYDNDFRLSTVRFNNANPATYTYDADSLLTQVAFGSSGTLTLSRNAQNGLLTGTALGQVNDSYTYNGFGEPTTYLARFSTTNLFRTDFIRDKLGRITQKIETTGGSSATLRYAYDLAGRLIEVRRNGVVEQSYGYDANGNRTQLNGAPIATYDNQDRLLNYNGATYSYTANGELSSKTQGANTTTYRYDVLGNLRDVALPNGTQVQYLIDGQNRRVGKRVNGTLVQRLVYQSQLRPEAELDGAGTLVSRFIYATGVNVPDFMVKGGVTYRLIKDHLGSPRLVVNTASNIVVQRMDYDAWGNVTQDTNPGFQPFGFAGGIYDRDTGLVRFGARDYDPVTGRWTAKDPIGFQARDSNLYLYARGDSIQLVDPNGQAPEMSRPYAVCKCYGPQGDFLFGVSADVTDSYNRLLGTVSSDLPDLPPLPIGQVSLLDIAESLRVVPDISEIALNALSIGFQKANAPAGTMCTVTRSEASGGLIDLVLP